MRTSRGRIISRVLGTMCLANLIGLLFFGLWPCNFSPENKASWVSGGKGLFFDGNRKPWKRSVGSIARVPSLKGSSPIPSGEKGAFTLAIRLQPASEKGGRVPHILSLVGRSDSEIFHLGQWKKSLIIRWPGSGKNGKRAWREIGVGEALLKDKAQWLAIASNPSGTIVSIDGKAAGRFPGKSILAEGMTLRHCSIVLGNSAEAKSPWTGTITALAVYETSFSEKEIFERWSDASGSLSDSAGVPNGLIAAFNLEGGAEERGSDISGNGNVLEIPARISIRGRMLEGFDNHFRTGPSLTNDAVVNVLGFIPYGFLVSWWIKIRRRGNRGRSIALVVLGGGLISLAIEMMQAYLPTRSSSLLDVICNTAGTLLGILAFVSFSLAVKMSLRIDHSSPKG